ncbi:uncharacterized protein FOMMEDRAFT_155075 [Fomitiporia mediterranea MF3/22]|uniref:uncharacterized protein n=1 Tax=Fomitiporia mediterranea (strain MF3/22) TaxID=694068 RepID=UPI0004407385|nr:uncharacterized protein FOMMEDRAFT_155075 [Fomitiporia mediterranea MF3/22]EJD03952.1 hypothetical protein FOMMEDRAFT_155075 [Fomitiporia mediterranea MF3/22]
MDTSSTPPKSAGLQDYPPLPEPGPPEDSDLALLNFSERERLSRSWHARLFTRRSTGVTLLERRSSVLSEDSDETSSHASASNRDVQREALGGAETADDSHTQRIESSSIEIRVGQSTDTGRISLREGDVEDPTKDQHLYRWVMVYENQRGISIFSARRYSTQSLLPRDPPPFSLVAPGSSLIEGRPVRKSQQPDISLDDFPLPDGNWRWASKEWMVDMREETVQHDGFEYNWFFRSKGWRPKAGRFNGGAWVRRRRWLRLMERPPIRAIQEGEIKIYAAQTILQTSLRIDEVFRGDEEDWPRAHRTLRELGRDGRKLEVWKGWITTSKSKESEDQYIVRAKEAIAKAIRDHMDELLRSFVFPQSRIEFLEMVTEGGLLSESDVLGLSSCSPCFVDHSHLEEVLPSKTSA